MGLSVIIIAKNEQDMIKNSIKSVAWADEIIVIDNGSTDETPSIAKDLGAKVVKFQSDDFSKTRNKGMEEAKNEWVLYIDADERVTKSLEMEILDVINGTPVSALAISRINIIFGEKVNYGPYKKDWVIRLFKKIDFETWVGKVHEYGKFKGELAYSKNSFIHLTHRDLDHFMNKALAWSKIDAELRLNSNHPKMSQWRFLRILITSLYDELIKRKGLFGGTVGTMDAILQSFSFFMTYIRLWQLQQPKPLQEKYQQFDKKLLDADFKYEG